jgi:hypothetical protein
MKISVFSIVFSVFAMILQSFCNGFCSEIFGLERAGTGCKRMSVSSSIEENSSKAAPFGADGLAFLRELDAVVFGVGQDGDEAAGFGEEPPDGQGGEDVRLADLTGQEEEDAGGVVAEDRFLVGTEFDGHGFVSTEF